MTQFDNFIEKYTTKTVCEKLGCKEHNLRYIIKQTGLQIEKDEVGNRWFTEADIEQIKEIIKHKNNGIPLKVVSQQLNNEASTESIEDRQSVAINQLQPLINELMNQFKTDLEIAVTAQTENITSELEEVRNTSQELKKIIYILNKENQENQENHFKKVDERLHQIMEANRKKRFFKRLFRG